MKMTSRQNLDSVWVYAMVCQKFIQAICKKKKQTKAKCTTVRESRRKYTYQYFLKIIMKDKGFAKH